MSAETGTMRVLPIAGEPYRYQVESWTTPGIFHVVDLLEAGGNGRCSCTDDGTTCQRNRKRNPGVFIDYGTPRNPRRDRTRCRHTCASIKFEIDRQLRIQAMARKQGGI